MIILSLSLISVCGKIRFNNTFDRKPADGAFNKSWGTLWAADHVPTGQKYDIGDIVQANLTHLVLFQSSVLFIQFFNVF